LEGAELQLRSRFFRRTLVKLRLRRMEKAKNRIEKLQEEIGTYKAELASFGDKIEEIQSEIEYRELLSGESSNG
jgi:chromosome segregation ATPase